MIKDFVGGIITYGLVFILGYYLGGGCENPEKIAKTENPYSKEEVKRKLENYQDKLNDLEEKIIQAKIENENE